MRNTKVVKKRIKMAPIIVVAIVKTRQKYLEVSKQLVIL